jgi:hypothetical protein
MRHVPVRLLWSLALLAGCGGGGGGEPSPDARVVAPAPAISLSLSEERTHVGGTVTISWSASDATSCEAGGAWSGVRDVSGTATLTASEGGRHVHRLRCTGPGGAAERSTTWIVPMPVLPSSYENAKHIRLTDVALPSPNGLGVVDPTWFSIGVAYADFFQEGAYSVVVPMAQWSRPSMDPPDAPARLFFLRRDAAGAWRDATSELLSDRATCVSARKLLVADFNHDRRPDVFLACHGHDVPPFPGENQRLLLSSSDGRYDSIVLPYDGFTHGGAAADLDGDGHVDVVLTLTNRPAARPYVLLGNGDGTFLRDDDRIPAALANQPIYNLELIDLRGAGVPDLLLGGAPIEAMPVPDPAASFPNGVLRNDGDGRFLGTPLIELPNPQGATGIHYGSALDFVLGGEHLYVYQTDFSYGGVIVNKVRLPDLVTAAVYEHRGAYEDGATWFGWIYPTGDGRLLGQGVNCTFPVAPASSCAVSFRE